jgi:hypothetical protein
MRAREFTINVPITISINGDDDPVISTGNEEEVQDDDVGEFVPPLQQKIELLKKSAGVKSVFDAEAGEDEPLE